jgi:hypothetical protein
MGKKRDKAQASLTLRVFGSLAKDYTLAWLPQCSKLRWLDRA